MEKIERYRAIIVKLLNHYAKVTMETGIKLEEFDNQLIIDDQHDHYQILNIGWNDMKRIYYPIIHIDIKGGKVWVQEDSTDFDIVGKLEDQGIPKEDIVLAFHAPYKRIHTGYAVA